MIKEYKDLTEENRSKITILASARGAFNRLHTLSHHTEGYEPAGSCARFTKEKWTVKYPFDGAIHGQAFKTEKEAREYFETYTKPIIEVRE